MDYPDVTKALKTLKACDANDCDTCPYGKKIGIDAHDAGVFMAFTACGMIQALEDAIQEGPLEWLKSPQPPLNQDA